MEVLGNKSSKKIAENYCCEKCDYNTSRKNNYEKHLLTSKHKKEINGSPTCLASNNNIYNEYQCHICYKGFKTSSGLWKHKKYHKVANSDNNNNNFLELIKQNQEFKELIAEQNKIILELAKNSSNQTTNISNTTNNNCHNKTFNLQVFLNEKCKDALNITDFVNSLNLSLTDLENVGENGFVDGISKIFVKGLKSLDIYKRPIHCSDLKRETMHVKEESGWEKDNENKDRLKKVVKMIAHKNMLKINDWKQKNPHYNNSDSKKNDQYLKILISSSGSYNKSDEDTDYNKIIKNVAKEVTIDKEM